MHVRPIGGTFGPGRFHLKEAGHGGTQEISVDLRDVDLCSRLVIGLVDVGVEEFDSGTYGLTGVAEKQAEVKLLAVKAVQGKASAIAGQLGFTARPVLISEFPLEADQWNEGTSLAFASVEGTDVYRPALAPNTVVIEAEIFGVFELVE